MRLRINLQRMQQMQQMLHLAVRTQANKLELLIVEFIGLCLGGIRYIRSVVKEGFMKVRPVL
jgi:hypothetical protein